MGIDLNALKQAYYEKLGKGKPTPAESIGKIGEAYKKAGGGLKGIGMGALQSIGSIAEMMNTPEGLKIAGYVSNNPYYLPQAEHLERAEMGNQHSIGELVKQDELLEGQKDIANTKFLADKTETERQERLKKDQEKEDLDRKKKALEEGRTYEEGQKGKQLVRETKEKELKNMVDVAKSAFDSKLISAEKYQQIAQNPLRYKLKGGEKGKWFGGEANVEEGKLMVDGSGNKAYVFSDGTVNEVQ